MTIGPQAGAARYPPTDDQTPVVFTSAAQLVGIQPGISCASPLPAASRQWAPGLVGAPPGCWQSRFKACALACTPGFTLRLATEHHARFHRAPAGQSPMVD